MEVSIEDVPPLRPEGEESQPRLPLLWIGYLLGVVTFCAVVLALGLQEVYPQAKDAGQVFALLMSLVGGIYWLYCVYKFHDVMMAIRGWQHPITSGSAVARHFIPFYNFYWVFHWPAEIARFVNWRMQTDYMKPWLIGLAVLLAFLVRFLVEPGIGLILLFASCSYIARCLRKAFAAPAVPAEALAKPGAQGVLGI